MTHAEPRWDPRAPEVVDDQIAAYDAARGRCPVAHGADGAWTVFAHAEAVRILDEPERFSNVVSSHLNVPNGMDGAEHAAYRAIVEGYFTPARVDAFAPACRAIARDLAGALTRPGEVEVMEALAEPFAARVACAFMGWPASLYGPLIDWIHANHRAIGAGDRDAMAAVAEAFDGYIREQLDERRDLGVEAPDDPTSRLLAERVDGAPLTDAQIVSIVRNWTVGELGTIAASAGILVDLFAQHPRVQARLRAAGDGEDELFDAVSDEALRLHPPLIANRRRTTCPVTIAGREVPAGERVVVLWASVNRDEAAFDDPYRFDEERDPAANLLYGRGVHVCPGAGLARMELRTLMRELLAATEEITPAPGTDRALARPPGSGFAQLSVCLR